MKINVFLPHFGASGGIRAVFEIANRLSARHEVRLLAPMFPVERHFEETSVFDDIREWVHSIKDKRDSEVTWMSVDAETLKIPHLSAKWSQSLAFFVPDADISIATSWQSAYGVASLPESKGKKYYFVQHYEIWPLWNSDRCWDRAFDRDPEAPGLAMAEISPPSPELKEYKQYVDRSYSLPMDLIITSEWEQAVMDRLGVDFVGAVKYGVNHDLFSPNETGETTDINERRTMSILALFRNNRHKGDEEAISAFQRLHKEYPSWSFIMFGKHSPDGVPDFVDYYRDPSQTTIRDLYTIADILVYPSWVEGFGMPPMEAMACETAVVSTPVGGVPEYAPDNGVVFVPIRDVDAIVEAVERVCKDPESLVERKLECRRAMAEYTWDDAARTFASLLNP